MKQTNQTNYNKGITLIALVITIIVLLILAGVTIATLTGENGILKRATDTVVENAHAEVKESMNLEYENYMIEKHQGISQKDLIGYLLDGKIIEETETEGKYKINVKNLLNNKTITTGKGTNGKDVYMLEETQETGNLGKIASTNPVKIAKTEETSTGKKYKIVYYGEKENRELGLLVDVNVTTATEPPEEEKEGVHKLKVGDYVQLPYNDTTIECMVLYDDDYNSKKGTNYGIQMITTDTVGNGVTFGGDDIDNIVYTYNKAIEILNDKAGEFVNTSNEKYISSARCVGSVPDNPYSESKDYVDITDDIRIKCEDSNNSSDSFQFWNMLKSGVNIVVSKSKEKYWIASRMLMDTSVCDFYGLRCSRDSSYLEEFKWNIHEQEYYDDWVSNEATCFDGENKQVYTNNTYTYKIRPVFTVNPNLKDQIYGTGTQEDPYRWTENVKK